MDLLTTRTSPRGRRIVAGLAILAAVAGGASAQTVSPGPLSRFHSNLEGVKNCTQCHELGKRVIDAGRCLACHTPLRSRIQARLGYHASAGVASKPCEGCHHEHVGREAPLVSWGGPEQAFDHAPTGWPLEGAHRKAACADCHDARRIRQGEARAYLERNPGARTFLGLERSCGACHFDEHRGALASDCSTCHGVDSWKPAPRFDHSRTAYPLRGRHLQVACDKCHTLATDPSTAAGAFPPPRAATYLRMKPVAHAECSACHADPHQGRLGPACASCHAPDSWTGAPSGGVSFDHSRARFPLEGRHRSVRCERCHPPDATGKPKLIGIAFARCSDCHEDAHDGQVKDAGGLVDCASCHTVDGFAPVRFSLQDHARTRYPLQGGHQSVPCRSCHPADPALAQASWSRPPRVLRADSTRLSYGGLDLKECATCHPDPHAGQFTLAGAGRAAKACPDCHQLDSFHKLIFDHGRDTSFPLRGKHASTACATCHPARKVLAQPQPQLARWMPHPPADSLEVVSWRPTPTSCEECHADPHLGQFAQSSPRACGDCHTEEAFTPASRFDHARARFALTGAHGRAKCAGCHRQVQVLPSRAAALYRPLPLTCEGCHEDPHGGAFRLAGAAVACSTCHATAAWEEVRFDHDRTGFRLGQAHAGVACAACHPPDHAAPPPRACAACHQDPHGRSLGVACQNCHLDAASFRDPAAAGFHERTRFPLLGRHAALPCESCHVDRASSAWNGLDPRCASCHLADYGKTAAKGLDHRAWGFSTTCETCHDAFRWDLVTFPDHERCFRIRSGPHSGIACLDCHTSLPSQPVSNCDTMTAACTRCHRCQEMDGRHAGVPGYECRDRKCYECHPSAGSD